MNEKFQEWLKEKGYELKETVLNDDNTVKEEGTSAQEMAGYFIEYNTEKREEMAAAVKEDNQKLVDELRAEFIATKEEQGENLHKLLKAVSEIGVAVKKTTDVAEGDVSLTDKNMTLEQALTEKADIFKGIKENNSRDEFVIKVAGDMTILGNVTGNIPVEQREAGVNNIARRRVFIRELVNNGTAVSNLISWVEEQNEDGSPAGTVEGTTKNQIDFDLVVVSEAVKKRTDYIKISTEMLDDIPFMTTEVNNTLFTRLNLDVDDQILNGDNTGQNLNGIITQSTAWAAGAFALTVNQANLVDVLTVAANQIEVANHMATVHVVHPTDLTALKLIKAAADVQYVDRLIMVDGTMTLDGIRVVSNTGITIDNFLTMDGSKDTVFSKGEIQLQFGLDGNDLTKNMRTIIAEWRGLNRIQGNDLTAFVTGVISTSIAALETA